MRMWAAALDDPDAWRKLLIDHAGEDPLPGFLGETGDAVEIVVIGKRRLLIERLHDLRNV